jgi:MFS family permease
MSALLYSVIGSAIVAVLYGLFVAQREAQLWQWLIFGSAIVAVLCGLFVFRAGITWSFALSRPRALRRLQRRRDRLKRLKECNREYYDWLLSGILWVLAIFAGTMLLHALTHYLALGYQAAVNSQAKAVDDLCQFLVLYGGGMLACVVAGSRTRTCRSLQAFDQSMASLDRAIAKLEAKLPRSVQPAATRGDGEEKAP